MATTKSLSWQHYQKSKQRKTIKGKVVESLIDNGNLSLNARSLVQATGLEMSSITRALNDLESSGTIMYLVARSKHTGLKVKHYRLSNYSDNQTTLF